MTKYLLLISTMLLLVSCSSSSQNQTEEEVDTDSYSGTDIDTKKPDAENPDEDYVYTGDLEWTYKLKKTTWSDAKAFCKNLVENGKTGWWLPTINELRSIIIKCPNTQPGGVCKVSDPDCLDGFSSSCWSSKTCHCDDIPSCYSVFGDTEILWSSSPETWNGLGAWFVNYGYGNVSTDSRDAKHYIRCVREKTEAPDIDEFTPDNDLDTDPDVDVFLPDLTDTATDTSTDNELDDAFIISDDAVLLSDDITGEFDALVDEDVLLIDDTTEPDAPTPDLDMETPDTDAANTRTFTCDPKPEVGTVWNTVASYEQAWDGTAWGPADSATTYNATESSTSCHYICADNYTWDNSTCNADARSYSCAGLPANARWNTVDSITQTWNGLEWIPSTTGVYNTDSSVLECRYKCDTFYTWVDSACVMASGVLCTGQTLCYNGTMTTTCPVEGVAYYGQDAQYAALGYCIPHDYTVSGTNPQELVTDNVTGLQWQRTLSTSTYTWATAVTYCEDLDYGGYSDWRLPTAPELETLPDYGRSHPEIDTTTFPDTPSELFWTSSSVANDSTSAWYVYFANNYVSYTPKTTANLYARCVRGAALPTSSFVEATVGGKVIVTDTTTDLIWTKEYSGSTTWVNALSYCENLDYGGYSDWRLPDFNELKTLIDRTLVAPASSFPGMPTNMFWSSSSSVFYPDSVWLVDFDYGGVNGYPKTNSNYARCVR